MDDRLAAEKSIEEIVVSLQARYFAGQSFNDFVSNARVNADLWQALSRRAQASPAAVDRLREIGGRWRLLVLAEEWCGDAVNTLSALAALAARAGNVDVRVLSRDDNPDLMDAHLSPVGSRAIPVVIVLDDAFVERGWWGSRPAALQQWVDSEGRTLGKEERYREIRRWYARDRGETAIGELIGLIEQAKGDASASPPRVGLGA